MVLYGSEGKSKNVKFERKSDGLQTGDCSQFKADIDDVGTPFKLRVSISDQTYSDPWHLDRVTMKEKSNELIYFSLTYLLQLLD